MNLLEHARGLGRILVDCMLFEFAVDFLIFAHCLWFNFYFTDAVGGNINVVDTILEFASHLISVFVERLLDGVLVASCNLWLQLLG